MTILVGGGDKRAGVGLVGKRGLMRPFIAPICIEIGHNGTGTAAGEGEVLVTHPPLLAPIYFTMFATLQLVRGVCRGEDVIYTHYNS